MQVRGAGSGRALRADIRSAGGHAARGEAAQGTRRAASNVAVCRPLTLRHQVVDYQGEMLLQGAHDAVDVVLLKTEVAAT